MAARLTAYLVALIVGTTLIAGLIVGAQRDDQGPVDLIVLNGRVYTADGNGTMAEAVAVQGNKIVEVGSSREVQRLRRPQTVVVDARGGAVLPGFNDSHLHLLSGGLALTQIDLLEARTQIEIEELVRGWAAANPDAYVGDGARLVLRTVRGRVADAAAARSRSYPIGPPISRRTTAIPAGPTRAR